MGTLREEQYIFLIISRSFLLRMKMFQTRVARKITTNILCSSTFI